MGWLGRLFAGRGDVRGRISVLERREDARYIFRVAYFPVERGAPPPWQGFPPREIFHNAPVGESRDNPDAVDRGETFTASLAPGHYQMLVMSLPFRIQDGEGHVLPAGQEVHWPLSTAFEVRRDETCYLSLKLTMKLADIEESAPFLERIGPGLARRYRDAVDLANAGRSEDAMRLYAAALSSREAEQLAPKDQRELRIVMVTSTAKCLIDLGRPEEARTALDGLGDVERVLEESRDVVTRGDYLATAASVAAKLRRFEELQRRAVRALEVGQEALEDGAPTASWMADQAMRIWTYSIRALCEAGEHERLLALAPAGQQAAAIHAPLRELGLLCTLARIEALSATGQDDEARAVARKVLGAAREAGWAPVVLDGIEQVARDSKLARALKVLADARS